MAPCSCQVTRYHETVTAVVSRAAHNKSGGGVRRPTLEYRMCSTPTRVFHQHQARHLGSDDKVLIELLDLPARKDWLHGFENLSSIWQAIRSNTLPPRYAPQYHG
jgi:hypothetical protein